MVSGAVVFLCHRASCNKTGKVDGNVTCHSDWNRPGPVEFVPRVYSGTIEELPDDVTTRLTNKYGISPETCRFNVRWNSDSKRTVWQIASPLGAVRGYELRDCFAVAGQDRAKTIHYRHSPDPWIGYTSPIELGLAESWSGSEALAQHKILIVVEDVVSALKISPYTRAASLMGTSLSLEKAGELGKVSQNIILALDKDATEKARMLIQRYAFLVPNIRLLPLQKDMKYWSGPEIEELVYIGENLKKI
jgi:hypothetical protein